LNKQNNVEPKSIKRCQFEFGGSPEIPASCFELRNQGLQHKKENYGEVHKEKESFQELNEPFSRIIRVVAKN
jgi:hypothetical protein